MSQQGSLGTASGIDPSAAVTRPGLVPSNPDGLTVRPILKSADLQKLSFTRTTDARTALSRGLKEWLEEQTITWTGGRPLFFERVMQVWADGEVDIKYPSAALVAFQPATYEASNLTPVLAQTDDGTKRYIAQAAELSQSFDLTIWAADNEQRSGLVAMVEDALEPVDFMTGLLLELPYYWNARATYEKLTVDYEDSPADAQRRWRKAVITVMGNVPQYRPVGAIRPMRPQIQLTVDDGATEVRGVVPEP